MGSNKVLLCGEKINFKFSYYFLCPNARSERESECYGTCISNQHFPPRGKQSTGFVEVIQLLQSAGKVHMLCRIYAWRTSFL